MRGRATIFLCSCLCLPLILAACTEMSLQPGEPQQSLPTATTASDSSQPPKLTTPESTTITRATSKTAMDVSPISATQTPTVPISQATPTGIVCGDMTASDGGRYSTPDGQLWALVGDGLHVGGQKVLWWRAGSTLEVSGRRLDAQGDVPPMYADLPCCYDPDYYQASGLYFPTGGCWEITARAGERTLQFVVRVAPYPSTRSPATADGSCNTLVELSEAVKSSDNIIVGTVLSTERDPSGYAWQNVSIDQLWSGAPIGDRILILQDTRKEYALMQDHTYLLFLRGDPLQIFCPEYTLAERMGAQANTLVTWLGSAGSGPLWSGTTLDALEKEIEALQQP